MNNVKFHNHMIETEAEKIQRVSKKISKILEDEKLVFDINMIPQMRIVPLPTPNDLSSK